MGVPDARPIPKSATYYCHFALWRDDGTDQVTHDLLRCPDLERAGWAEDPTAAPTP
jgi:hypothetical protein